MIVRRVLFGMALLLLAGLVNAQTMYVTDRILLGVHQSPQEDSVLLESVVSGTEVEVTGTQVAFSKIKLPDGTEGWVSSAFLKQEKPAVAEVDELYKKYQEASKTLEQLNEQISKKDRELQVRRDELSNAKTTIRELKKQKATGGPTNVVDESELQEAEEKIKLLSQQLAEAKAARQAAEQEVKQVDDDVDLAVLQRENANLRARIESAQANLAGETVPSPEQLAAIRPEFPVWYWGLLFLVMILGVIGGLLWMDYKHRMRHGGFRI